MRARQSLPRLLLGATLIEGVSLMYGFILLAIALMALGGLMLAMNLRALERRAALIEEQTSRAREEARRASDDARRAHIRLDNHQRQLEALGHELGWVDDRAHTKVITSKLPREEKE